MSISFNVLSYLLNMKRCWLRVYKTPLSFPAEESVFTHGHNMRATPLRALSAVLYAALLVILAQGAQKDGVYTRFPLLERPTGHHLPTYMVHLYRNFTANFSKPVDAMEQSGAKRADTVKSVMAKSEFLRAKMWIR